jgi:sulfatase maturation enzyme AslB (radical SAM superfamily)
MKNFCVLPFYSVEIDPPNSDNVYCCRLPVGTDINEIRQSILNGERNPKCSACWNLEDRGIESERMIHNRTFDYYLDRDLGSIYQDVLEGKSKSRIIKLATSNTCNGTCITCDHTLSSSWAALEKRRPIMIKIDRSKVESIQWQEVVQLSLIGGEPLLEKYNFEILQNLIDIGNTACFISIVTNGSIELSSSQIGILSRFKNLNICLSIDAVEEKFEYIRYPLQWKLLVENLKIFRSVASDLSTSTTVSNLNIFYLDETINFIRHQNIKYYGKQTVEPEVFSPGNLPQIVKKNIMEKKLVNHDQVFNFLNFPTYSEKSFHDFWREIDRQDSLKKIKIQDYLPEVATTRIYDTCVLPQETSSQTIDF